MQSCSNAMQPSMKSFQDFVREAIKTHTCIGAKMFPLSRKILLQGCLKQHLAEMRARVHEKKSFIFSQKWSLWHTCASVQNCFRNAVTLKQGYCKPYLISMGRGLLLIFIWRLSDMLVLRSDISYKLLGQNQYATYDWLVVLGLTALRDSISVYTGPSPREREKEKRSDRWEKKCPNNPHPHLLQAQ